MLVELTDEHKILDRCSRLFMRYGAKSITMDDVARELGMSKKTLYQHFSNKKELMKKVTAFHFANENEAVCSIALHSENAIEELLNISKWISTQMKGINPTLIYDLQKYHPESWQLFVQHRNRDVFQTIINNIRRGIAEGLYRDDLNPEIITRTYIARMEVVVDPEVFPPGMFSFQDIHREFITYHIRGLASDKGLQYLAQYQNQTNVTND